MTKYCEGFSQYIMKKQEMSNLPLDNICKKPSDIRISTSKTLIQLTTETAKNIKNLKKKN